MNHPDSFEDLCAQVYGKRKPRYGADEGFRDEYDDSDYNDDKEEYD